MKFLVLSLLSVLVFPHVAESAALEEGAYAPCAVLEGISSSGSTFQRCIREPEKKGQERTLLKFFSATCSDCLQLHKKMVDAFSGSSVPEKVKFNLVGIDRNSNLLKEYARTQMADMSKLGSSVFIDSDRDAKNSYGVQLVPTVYLLNNVTNRILYRHIGVMSEGEFNKFVQLLEND